MEQTTVHATEDYLRSQIAEKDERILTLEQHSQRVTQRDFNTAAELNALREDLKEFTVREFQNNDITNEQAEQLAVIGGFELTNEVEVMVTVEYSMTINVPAGEDVEDIIHDIDFDAISYDTDKITYVSSSLSGVEF
jgi:hypothetical protein